MYILEKEGEQSMVAEHIAVCCDRYFSAFAKLQDALMITRSPHLLSRNDMQRKL
jgi:hypothetical protein